jgi:hypothetical protein
MTVDAVPAHLSETRCHTGESHENPPQIIGILVGVGFTVIAGAAAAQPATFMIVNYGSGLCLEPNGSGLGAPILQQPCDSTRLTQRWVASPATATQYQIANKGYPTCLDVRNAVNADRTVVQQWTCDIQARSMRWQLSTSFRTVSLSSSPPSGHGVWTSPGARSNPARRFRSTGARRTTRTQRRFGKPGQSREIK